MVFLYLLLMLNGFIFCCKCDTLEDPLQFKDNKGNEYSFYKTELQSDGHEVCRRWKASVVDLSTSDQVQFLRKKMDELDILEVMTDLKFFPSQSESYKWPNGSSADGNLIASMRPIMTIPCKNCYCVVMTSQNKTVTIQPSNYEDLRKGFVCQRKAKTVKQNNSPPSFDEKVLVRGVAVRRNSTQTGNHELNKNVNKALLRNGKNTSGETTTFQKVQIETNKIVRSNDSPKTPLLDVGLLTSTTTTTTITTTTTDEDLLINTTTITANEDLVINTTSTIDEDLLVNTTTITTSEDLLINATTTGENVLTNTTMITTNEDLVINTTSTADEDLLINSITIITSNDEDLLINTTTITTNEDLVINTTSTTDEDLLVNNTTITTNDNLVINTTTTGENVLINTTTITTNEDLVINTTSTTTNEDLVINTTSTADEDLLSNSTTIITSNDEDSIINTTTITTNEDLVINTTSTADEDLLINSTTIITSNDEDLLINTTTITTNEDLVINTTSTTDEDLFVNNTTITTNEDLVINATSTTDENLFINTTTITTTDGILLINTQTTSEESTLSTIATREVTSARNAISGETNPTTFLDMLMTTKDYGRKHGVSDSTLQPQRSNHSLKDLIHKAPLPEYRVWTSPPSAETAATKKHVTPTVKRNKTSELERTLEKFQSENLTKHLPVATDLLKSVSAILDVGDTSKDTKSLPLSLSPEELLYVGEEVFASASPDKLISPALDHNSSNRTRVEHGKLLEDYAVSFMEVTSALLSESNTNSWKKIATTQSERDESGGLTPTTLLKKLDDVIDYYVEQTSVTSKLDTVMINTSSLEVRVATLVSPARSHLDVTADGSVNRTNSNKNTYQTNGTKSTVVTALYKTVPQILNACLNPTRYHPNNRTTTSTPVLRSTGKPLELNAASSQKDKIMKLSGNMTVNACLRMGFPVNDVLCTDMLNRSVGLGGEPGLSGYWTFPSHSDVLSITAYELDGYHKFKPREKPVRFRIRGSDSKLKTKCVFFDKKSDIWSDFGCQTVSTSKEVSTCYCNHTTNFAILLLVPLPSTSNNDARQTPAAADSPQFQNLICDYFQHIFRYVAGGLSIAFLLASILFFAYARQTSERTKERNTVHMFFAISMLLLHAILLVDIPESLRYSVDAEGFSEHWICIILAALTHYFLLCTFAWMTLEGILLFLLVVAKQMRRKKLGKWKHVIGWLLPLVVVIITLAVGKLAKGSYLLRTSVKAADNEGGQAVQECYLSKDLSWAAFIPVASCITFNFFIVLRVLCVIARLTKERRLYRPASEHSSTNALNVKALKKSFSAFCKLNPILGFPWILGVVASFVPGQHRCWMLLAHTLLNGFQGVFFFIVCVIQNEESRTLVHITWRKVRHNTHSLVSSVRARKGSSYHGATPMRRCVHTPPGSGRHTQTTPAVAGRVTNNFSNIAGMMQPCESV